MFIGMLQMLKLRSREASAIVKFVFLILLDLAGQFVDFVSFDGCDVIVAWSRAREPSGIYHQTCFMLSPSTAPWTPFGTSGFAGTKSVHDKN